MTDYLLREGLKASDEAWLVVDKDNWSDQQLNQLSDWTTEASNRSLAVSNPKFEYWLLLHFEEGTKIGSKRECTDRLKTYLPDYDKSIDRSKFSFNMIRLAVERAKRRDNPPCALWPITLGGTTVYRLVESVLED
jgi:hypothetical protein